jgi:hypothetical protein
VRGQLNAQQLDEFKRSDGRPVASRLRLGVTPAPVNDTVVALL